MNKGLLIVVSGPSGTGKGTVCKQLLNTLGDMKLSISATTRSARAGEIEGSSYFFISKDRFEGMIEGDEFLEYANVYGNYYGTPRQYVLNEIDAGHDVLLEIDPQGALQVKAKYPHGVFIFILPPSMGELKKRIINRGTESEDSINKRYQSAFDEITFVKSYNYFVVNDEVSRAVQKIQAIIQAEKCKVTEDIEEIIKKFKEES